MSVDQHILNLEELSGLRVTCIQRIGDELSFDFYDDPKEVFCTVYGLERAYGFAEGFRMGADWSFKKEVERAIKKKDYITTEEFVRVLEQEHNQS